MRWMGIGIAVMVGLLAAAPMAGAQQASADAANITDDTAPDSGPATIIFDKDDLYAIQSLPIEGAGESVVNAKEEALNRGILRGLDAVLRQLTPQNFHDRLPMADQSLISALIRDYHLADEKFGGGRYLAQLGVRFSADAINDLLRQAAIPIVAAKSKPLLVLPLLTSADGQQKWLWHDQNSWLAAWARRSLDSGVVPLLAPLGDSTDIAFITAPQLTEEGLAERLAALRDYYHAGAVLITEAHAEPVDARPAFSISSAIAAPLPDQQWFAADQADPAQAALAAPAWGSQANPMRLRVVADVGLPQATAGDQPAADGGQPFSNSGLQAVEARLFDQAINMIKSQLQTIWKEQHQLRYDLGVQEMVMLAPLTSLADWVALQQQLEASNLISQRHIMALTTDLAIIRLGLYGSVDQIGHYLLGAGYQMTPLLAADNWPAAAGLSPQPQWLLRKEFIAPAAADAVLPSSN